ncbi:uncharacterized protein LOC124260025 isoform X2 [Haliotis rubra]|uniref:uncharacterized protein LOC124260025 isoform X2 n=1 Tax=Haliotis rubra TaxID=36100 RepID=UPI001EE5AE76|nr:uncharacterized protein LOC124260025 isoform X2 [Haliotis rubra]
MVNTSHTWYRDREIPVNITPSEFRFTLYNVTTEDAGLYECRTFDTTKGIPGCEQLLVVAQKPSTPNITGPTSAVSGGRVTLTCSSSSLSLPPDHPPLTMTYIWRRNSEKIQGGEDVHVEGPNLTMRHISKAEDGNYSCQAIEGGLKSEWSHGHDLDVQYREVQQSLSPDTPMPFLLVSVGAVLLLLVVVVVLLLVCGIRRCRRLRAKRKLRYAAHLTALNNRASSESPYATVHVEGARVSYSNMSEHHYANLPLPSYRSDATADYVALGQEEHVHIYTALRPKVRQQVGGGRRKADTAGGSP